MARLRAEAALRSLSRAPVQALSDVRLTVARGLRARRGEIEDAVFAGVCERVRDPVGLADTEYVTGLRAAVVAAVEYGLAGIENADESLQPIPAATVSQARRAARGGVSMDTVLRRYTVGATLLEDFILQEAESEGFLSEPGALRYLLRAHGFALQRLTAAVAEEYGREHERTGRSPGQQRVQTVRRLLAGEPADASELGYEFGGWHLGAIALGAQATATVERVGVSLRCRLLSVPQDRQTVWAWLGSSRRLESAAVERVLGSTGSTDLLMIGEPGEGYEGWRTTHRQAQEALLVGLRSKQSLTRFADTALIGPWLADPVRARALVRMYLSPLDSREDGDALRRTLRAYFETGHNTNAAAAALGVDRSTVRRRIRAVEGALGCALERRQAELEVAMRLEEFARPAEFAAGRTAAASPPASEPVDDESEGSPHSGV